MTTNDRSASPSADSSRREAILRSAWNRFRTHGYEGASVQAIIEAAGASKGAFYHHFESKEDLVDALNLQITETVVQQSRSIIDDPDLSALGKLNLMMQISWGFKSENMHVVMELAHVMYREGNQVLLHRLREGVRHWVQPMWTEIIQQGIDDGVFHCEDATLTAMLLLGLMQAGADHNMRYLLEAPITAERARGLLDQLRLMLRAGERLLGATSGAIEDPDPELVDVLLRVETSRCG